MLDLARQVDLGVRSFVSVGNKADVSGNDLLAAWLHDPEVSSAALYLESFGNAPKFERLAARGAGMMGAARRARGTRATRCFPPRRSFAPRWTLSKARAVRAVRAAD